MVSVQPDPEIPKVMRGVWLEGGRVSLRPDLPVPESGPGEALVRVSLAGICGTDLGLLQGYADFVGIPGHEFCGQIVHCPETPERVGQRVVGEINIACGACRTCLDGHRNHCERRRVLGIRRTGGAFAEYLTLPASNLHSVPDSIADTVAVFTEPLAAALRIREQLAQEQLDSVLIVGAGRLGQLIARALSALAAGPDVVIRHPRQGTLLRGVAGSVFPESEVPERRYGLVVEATGAPSGLAVAVKAVRPLGTILLKSTYPKTAPTDLSQVVVDEIKLLGSRCGPFQPALRLLEAGLEVESLVDEILSLEDAVDAFRIAARPGAMKILLRC